MRIFALLESKDGKMWAGTYENGLQSYDGTTWQAYNALDGLPDNTVYTILEDSKRMLWFRTTDGIGMYNPHNNPPLIVITEPQKQVVERGTKSLLIEWRAGDIETETHRLTYQYKLDNGPWIPTEFAFAMLTELDDGENILSVRAIDRDFNYSENAKLKIIVDTIQPNVLISSPTQRAVIGGGIKITGGVADSDLEEFRVEYAIGDNPSEVNFKLIRKAYQVVGPDVLAEWDTRSIPEHSYTIRLIATDKLKHKKDYSVTVTVDNTPPTVKITSPADDQSFSGAISIKGRVSDDNLKSYELTWTQATEIDSNTIWHPITSKEPQTSDVAIQQVWDSSAVYGLTTVRLLAVDKAGNKGTSDITINLQNDSAKPTVHITSPSNGAKIKDTLEIKGTASDVTPISYTIELGAGREPKDWTIIAQGTSRVKKDTLATWDTAPYVDGEYTLRLTATDSNGYASTTEPLFVILDNKKPPIIIGTLLLAFCIPTVFLSVLLVRQRRKAAFQPIPNPFIVGNPIRTKEMFFGRQDDFEFIRTKLQNSDTGLAIVLCGERRSGKTSILFQILNGALGENFVSVLVDMQLLPARDENDFYQRISHRIARTLPSLEPTLSQLDWQNTAPSRLFEQLVEMALEQIDDKSLLLLVDEYELLEEKIDAGILSKDVITFLAGLLDSTPRISFCFTGSRYLEEHNPEYWPALLPKSIYRKITYLSESDAHRLITEPVRGKVHYQRGVVDTIYRMTAGQPFYTQVLCQNLVDELNRTRRTRVQRVDVEKVVQGIVETPLPQMVYFWDSLSQRERVVLSLVAEQAKNDRLSVSLEDLEIILKQIHAEFPIDMERADLRMGLESLVSHDYLVKPPSDGYRFKMDLLRRWIHEAHSIWEVLSKFSADKQEV